MAQLIDTGVLISLERRRLPLSLITADPMEEPVALAAITASELLVGVHRADSPQRRLIRAAFVEEVLETVPLLPFDLSVARLHAEIWTHLIAGGQPVGFNDMLIAATALAHGYAVLTHNLRDFDRVPGLEVRQPQW